MKKFLSLAIFCVFVGGCSQTTTENVTTRNSNTGTKNADAANLSAQTQNTNVSNTTMEEFMNANNVPSAPSADGDSANSANLRTADSMMSAMEKRGRGKRANTVPVDPHARQLLTAAPDNSEIYTEMNQQGQSVEMRIFKNNPSLDKVVRTHLTAENQQVKIYLKNGKVIDLPKDKFDNVFDVSADEILSSVGAAPQKPAPASKN